MKKRFLLSSFLMIALCLCLIAGSTFALFTNGPEIFIKSHQEKLFDKIYSTNLTYVPNENYYAADKVSCQPLP